jgi:hypothetical protein
MPQVLQCPSDSRVAPARILVCHADDQTPNLPARRVGPLLSGVRPLARDEFAMPTENGVRRHDGRDVHQHPGAETLSEDGEPRRSSSLNRMRRPRSCARSTRFSSRRNSISHAAHVRAGHTAPRSAGVTESRASSPSPVRFNFRTRRAQPARLRGGAPVLPCDASGDSRADAIRRSNRST